MNTDNLLNVFVFFLAVGLWPGAAAAASIDLAGTEWRLIELDGEAVPVLPGDNQPSIRFDADGEKVSGYSGCNRFFATLRIEGDALHWGPVGATRRACQGAGGELEAVFLRALGRAGRWRIVDGQLAFLDAGQVLARFAAEQAEQTRADVSRLLVHSSVYPEGPIQLRDGAYSAPAAPGSAAMVSVRLTDQRVFWSLNDVTFGALVAVSDTGGSGTISELLLLVQGRDGWKHADSVLLGDRVKVQTIAAHGTTVELGLLTHAADDPLCCPTKQRIQRFEVVGEKFVSDPRIEPGPAAGADQ
jgi:heat shock protein HslJ